MNGYYVLDKKGEPKECDLFTWAKWFEKADRVVARTGNVSTVFLGLDHSFGGDVPELYETIIFGGKLDGGQERYATKKAAEEGHKKWVKLVEEAR